MFFGLQTMHEMFFGFMTLRYIGDTPTGVVATPAPADAPELAGR
jgi:hypothetical protein